MLRSLYSGVSGMKNLQTKMDVISNNIANVNTTGFKSNRVLFQDLMSQTTQGANGPANGLGGTNATQIGLGVQTGAISTDFAVGAPQGTGNAMDFYITGSGFFIVKGQGNETFYTRDGALVRDSQGNITNNAGMKLQGVKAAENTKYGEDFDPAGIDPTEQDLTDLEVPKEMDGKGYQSMSIDQNGLVLGKYGDETYVLGKVAMVTFNNPGGLEKAGGNNYTLSANSGEPIVSSSGQNGAGSLEAGNLEMSNVDLSTEFTEMIIASRAYQANSRSITTSDEMLQELINLKR